MHQTFYIEVDEEISSVIDKLRRSLSVGNYFVVPKRALVVQSIVNLKLLRREADKFKKNIILVTTDDQTVKMAERAGIKVQSSLEGLDYVEDENNIKVEKPVVPDQSEKKKSRLVGVGSADYYGNASSVSSVERGKSPRQLPQEHLYAAASSEVSEIVLKKPVRIMDDFKKNVDLSENSVPGPIRRSPVSDSQVRPTKKVLMDNYDLKESLEAFLDTEKEKKINKMFQSDYREDTHLVRRDGISAKERSGGKKLVFASSLLALLFFAGASAYLFVPKADVFVYLDTENKKIEMTVTADSAQATAESENLKIPTRLIRQEGEVILSHKASGIGDSAGQKSRGTLVIYNEYSSSIQPLIVTTRFETEDGMIFRLAKSVSVPGASEVGGISSPGAIEVEVVADAPGEAFNIEPTSFKIPGFRGTDKYEKIYAKSAKAMSGGGAAIDSAKVVSQEDIDEAKKKAEEAVREKITEAAEAGLGEGEMMVFHSAQFNIIDGTSYAKNGDVKETFDYQAKASMEFFVVSRKDLSYIAELEFQNGNRKPYEYNVSDIAIELTGARPDFENKKVELFVSARIAAKPIFEKEDFKKKLVAKDEEQVRELMKGYPQIKNLEIGIRPDILSVIPRFEGNINLEIRDFQGN